MKNMSNLGMPEGIFDINNSDISVGSFFKKEDIKIIFDLSNTDLNHCFSSFKIKFNYNYSNLF